jgi:RNA polymerase sigma factor (TIGR02999 family)
MAEVTQILWQIEHGDPQAAAALLPLVYEELRRLAYIKLAGEKPGQTLSATALVHEAYLRLTMVADRPAEERAWNGRPHFFAAAAEAMRRILVESARRKHSEKHGGRRRRVDIDGLDVVAQTPSEELLAIDEVLDELAVVDPQAAQIVKLHFFAELTIEEAAAAAGTSERTAYRDWAFARAWLARRLHPVES